MDKSSTQKLFGCDLCFGFVYGLLYKIGILLKTADLFSPELGLAELTLEDVQVCTIVLNSVKV